MIQLIAFHWYQLLSRSKAYIDKVGSMLWDISVESQHLVMVSQVKVPLKEYRKPRPLSTNGATCIRRNIQFFGNQPFNMYVKSEPNLLIKYLYELFAFSSAIDLGLEDRQGLNLIWVSFRQNEQHTKWLNLPTNKQRILCVYSANFPIVHNPKQIRSRRNWNSGVGYSNIKNCKASPLSLEWDECSP